jgi:hypothetical protein
MTIPTVDDIDQLVTQVVIAEYWERGFWISPKLFDDEQVQRLRAAHARFWAGEYDGEIPSQYGIMRYDPHSAAVRQQVNAGWQNDEIRRAVTSPLLGKIGARLMGVDSARLWTDQIIYKPGAGDAEQVNVGNIGWHQDFGFWRACSTDNMVTAWVALQDTDLSNGAMRMVEGSHKWGLVEGSDTFGHRDLDKLAQRFAGLGRGEWREAPCLLKAGQASFHHSLVFHGSGQNYTDQPRLSVIAHLMPADITYRAGQQWHPNLVFLGPNAYDGQPFAGDYWPVVWPPSASGP